MEKVFVFIFAYISEIGLLTGAHVVSNPFIAFSLVIISFLVGLTTWFKFYKN